MKILSLQGGGCRGKGQAVALADLETRAGRLLCQVFELVGGTSVGAIIGAAVALGLPMREVNRFFDEEAPKIFAGSVWHTVRQLWRPKYDAERLTAALQSLFGNHTLGDCKTKLIITAFDVESGRNVYFQNYGKSYCDRSEDVFADDGPIVNWPLWQLVQASASAQSYFAAVELASMVLLDGGNTGCAAPDMLCLTEAMELGVPLFGIKMLSLGTGTAAWTGDRRAMVSPSAVRAGLATLDILFTGANASEVWQAARILGSNHYRLDPQLNHGFALDDACPETLAAMTQAMETEMANHPGHFLPFLT